MTLNRTHAHVLIVEDEQLDERLFIRCLKKHGVTFTTASRAFDAVSYLESPAATNIRLALVLLDWKLPGGGATVLRTIRQSPPLRLTPVVVLSRSEAHVDVRTAYEAGANAFVVKAYDLYEFERRLDSICTFWLSVVIAQADTLETAP
jgi:CheY-like chemotaxis protein